MDKLSELASDTAVLKAQFARQDERNTQREAEIKFLRGEVETLTRINDQSHNIRMRFISKYKRDVLNKATSTDHDAIVRRPRGQRPRGCYVVQTTKTI